MCATCHVARPESPGRKACDVGGKGEKAAQVVDQLGELASLGFQAAIGPVVNVWQVTPLEIIGSEVIPAVAGL